ncbi:MAG: Holliday junction resolvase RuvX [Gammaproteobacteria bacterium]|nr:Holliday junction resolvase RuvX [Gammaproteobacteria bacterium]
MPEGPLLGFDYGLRRIGVAVGQPLTGTASPLAAVGARDGKPDWEAISTVINEWRPSALVVGLPYNVDGSRQEITDRAEKFMRQLEGRYGLAVHAIDERYSSQQAEERLKTARREGRRGRIRKEEIDSAAACILLENWFDSSSSTG